MKIRNIAALFLPICFAILVLASCNGGKDSGELTKKDEPTVTVHELSDPDMLNPFNYQSADAGYMFLKLFQYPLGIDFKTLELVPVLAISRPEIREREDGKLLITYEIRPEATWDDGAPITARDIEFSLKATKCPGVDNQRIKPYFEFIEDMIFYDDNPRRYTFICREKYILAESSSGDIAALPSKVYDPENILSQFALKDFSTRYEELSKEPALKAFADNFNSQKYQREKGYIVGSGPYEFVSWETNNRIIIKRKENWWGNSLLGTNNYFEANAPQLIYQTIKDQTTALVALKSSEIDVMHGIKFKDFLDLPKSEKVVKNYNTHTPLSLAYYYLGINTRLSKFEDKRVRQALAHLLDVDKVINTVYYGLAERVIGFVHPSEKKFYNTDIIPYDYNPGKAKQLLAEAGWNDSNGNGTVDKSINGELVELEITYTFNAGNDSREATGLVFQEAARQVGINVTVVPQEWSVYLENQKNHNFEMFFGAWIASPTPDDPKQIWHTESYNGGSNYGGFGNQETDDLIDAIRKELDEDKRAVMMKQLQAIIHEEVPYIFIGAPKERIAIHKRFANAETSIYRPGYWEPGFQLKTGALAQQ